MLVTREKCNSYIFPSLNRVKSIQLIRVEIVDRVQHYVLPLKINYIIYLHLIMLTYRHDFLIIQNSANDDEQTSYIIVLFKKL